MGSVKTKQNQTIKVWLHEFGLSRANIQPSLWLEYNDLRLQSQSIGSFSYLGKESN